MTIEEIGKVYQNLMECGWTQDDIVQSLVRAYELEKITKEQLGACLEVLGADVNYNELLNENKSVLKK